MMTLAICILVFLFLLGAGFFAGAEVAVTSASRAAMHRAAAEGDRRAILAQRLLSNKETLLGTTLVGTNVMGVCATTAAALVVTKWVGPEWESLVNTIVMTPLILVISELVPKSIGRSNADRMAKLLARPLLFAQWAAHPLIMAVTGAAGGIARLFGERPANAAGGVTREDIRAIAELAGEEGVLPAGAAGMMQAVFDLSAKSISAVMIALVDVVAVRDDATVADVMVLARDHTYTRFPVYHSRIDEVIGVVDLRAVLYAIGADTSVEKMSPAEIPVRDFVQSDLVFVPETKSVGALLHELHYHKIPMAAAVDEHGGVVGIVTTEDLVEELVGDIRDERDPLDRKLQKLDAAIYECDGKLEVSDLEQLLGIEITHDGFETVGGLVMKLAGAIPFGGQVLTFRDYEITVLEVERRRVVKVRFRHLPTASRTG